MVHDSDAESDGALMHTHHSRRYLGPPMRAYLADSCPQPPNRNPQEVAASGVGPRVQNTQSKAPGPPLYAAVQCMRIAGRRPGQGQDAQALKSCELLHLIDVSILGWALVNCNDGL
jgi:hypothetical protein